MTRLTDDWIRASHTLQVMKALEAETPAYFVGGCVRNALLGQPVDDIDISTALRPDQVVALTEAAGLRAVPTGIEHGTITVVADGVPHEVTTFRKDVATDGRRATVTFADRMEDDAHRRDFTMNALYADADGRVIDPLGGLPDLKAGRVRFIDDPEMRIREDYLRILRFFRFHAWYGDQSGGIDADGLAASAALAQGIDQLSKERIGHEMLKLLAAPDPGPSLASMAQSGVLTHALPGADPAAIPRLVHLEGTAPADPIRRLSALVPEDPTTALRLSRQQSRDWQNLRDAAESTQNPGELGYRLGAEIGCDALLVRAALIEASVDPAALDAVRHGAMQSFPITAKDLMPDLSGPALGKRMKALEERWIASGFELTREALLGGYWHD